MRPSRIVAAAKINLALVVGPRRRDGFHEVATVLQRIDLCDRLELRRGEGLIVEGFSGDTIVGRALGLLAAAAGVDPFWRVRISKEIPVAAGLGGGSADAAAALRLANESLREPLAPDRLALVAASVGADVPFFLEPGPKLAEGVGHELSSLQLPQDFYVAVAIPHEVEKGSTAAVYARFDELGRGSGFEGRKDELLRALERVRRPADLAALPPNDLAPASGALSLAVDMLAAGAFRADVSGAGPSVYGLFETRGDARSAARRLAKQGKVWVAAAVW
jgi:4-diphosphocytidyl-2-C-methyl-D-erythritol kinase